MKTFNIGTVVGAALLLCACSTFSKASERNLYQVHLGETPSDLIAALGEPQSKSHDGAVEKWCYDIYSNDNREILPYTATFKDGVLKQWNYDSSRKAEDVRQDYNRMPASRF